MIEQRLQPMQEWLQKESIAYAFIQGKANIFYLTGFRCEPHERLVSLLIFPNHEPCLICPNMEKSLVLEAGWSHDIITYSDHESPWELISRIPFSHFSTRRSLAIEKEVAFLCKS